MLATIISFYLVHWQNKLQNYFSHLPQVVLAEKFADYSQFLDTLVEN
jgi:hypothetical protein